MIIERMANELGVSTLYIENLARGASHAYVEYSIKKRTGGVRTIHHPSKPLKALQRWLLFNVIQELPVHSQAVAYRKGRSILDNARAHQSSKYLLRMDLSNFFPSITQADLAKYIAERPALFAGWSAADIDTFCRIVCRKSLLTIGAPTSPALSNAICYDMDTLLQALAAKHGATYTRYADDLFFSTKQPNTLRQIETEAQEIIPRLKVPASLKAMPPRQGTLLSEGPDALRASCSGVTVTLTLAAI
jgi:RNA-directed DNA polymerase